MDGFSLTIAKLSVIYWKVTWFYDSEWENEITLLVKKYMSKKKEGKRKENDPVLFFRVSLPETKTELSFKSFTTGFLLAFFPLFYDIFVSETQTHGYKLVVKHVSHWYIKHVNSTCGYFFQASTCLCSLVLWPYSQSVIFLIKFDVWKIAWKY